MQNIIGIDIGGTKCAVSLGEVENGEITIINKETFQTSNTPDPFAMISKLQKGVEKIIALQQLSIHNIAAIGISCGGPLDSKRGLILSPPNLPGWDAIPVVNLFQEKFGIPVFLQNDANACALAEWKFGAGKGYRNVIFLTFGTGLGAGLIFDGRLYSGTNDMAGEVGHIRLENIGPVGYGKAGSFEGFCSGNGITQIAQIKIRERFQMGQAVSFCKSPEEIGLITAKAVAEAATNGDELAIEIYKLSGAYLGRGLSILIDVLNPEVIIIGSIIVSSGNLILPAAMEIIKREALQHSQNVCRILPAKLGDMVGDFAALSVAMYNLEQL
ncbi:MAG TPA: ROK family protein [Mucilaginibacter sp.]